MTSDEYPTIIKTAVDTCRGVVPIIAGAGGPTRFAIACAQAAEKAGAHGVLIESLGPQQSSDSESVGAALAAIRVAHVNRGQGRSYH